MLPHWNWIDGANVTVWAYSNADAVEVFLNGASLGRQTSVPYAHFAWPNVSWTPGELSAIAYWNTSPSTPVATMAVRTTGAPAALRVSAFGGTGAGGVVADARDVILVQVEVLDARGDVVPYADTLIEFAIDGGNEAALRILGTGNGDPASHTPDASPVRAAFAGRALAVLQSAAEGRGVGTECTVRAHAVGDARIAGDALEVVIVAPTRVVPRV